MCDESSRRHRRFDWHPPASQPAALLSLNCGVRVVRSGARVRRVSLTISRCEMIHSGELNPKHTGVTVVIKTESKTPSWREYLLFSLRKHAHNAHEKAPPHPSHKGEVRKEVMKSEEHLEIQEKLGEVIGMKTYPKKARCITPKSGNHLLSSK